MPFSFAADSIKVLWVSGRDVQQALSFPQCIDAVAAAMTEVSRGNAVLPLRRVMPLPNSQNMLGMMQGYLGAPEAFGVKLISLYPRNPVHGYPSHMGLYVLFEPQYGRPEAVMDANVVTAIRTAAASAVATRALARKDARVAAILGTGAQAHAHLMALPHVRELSEIRVWGRDLAKAQAVVRAHPEAGAKLVASDDLAATIYGADVICTVTAAQTPFFKGAWLTPGQHLNVVGSSVAHYAEVDQDTVTRSRFYVDYKPSTLDQAGELLPAIKAGAVTEDHIVAEIGAVLAGDAPGRGSEQEITLYKSLGVAAQDIAAARAVVDRARMMGLGVEVDL